MESNTVVPRLAMSPNVLQMDIAVVLSRPVVGSSKKRIPGSTTSSSATDTLLFSPPDRPRLNSFPICVSRHFNRPKLPITSSTRCLRAWSSILEGHLSLAWKSKCSRTVNTPGKTSCCATYPLTFRMVEGGQGRPFTVTNPCTRCMGLRAARQSSRDVLPAPEGPIRAVRDPRRAVPLTPRKICFSSECSPSSPSPPPAVVVFGVVVVAPPPPAAARSLLLGGGDPGDP
mmetsp:Transcript_61909/g.124148  ORF Transcript_61909/g.124148 Transcript_61909/m.124148 type:complete len:229 (+) Transcript_61909:217-903(+)